MTRERISKKIKDRTQKLAKDYSTLHPQQSRLDPTEGIQFQSCTSCALSSHSSRSRETIEEICEKEQNSNFKGKCLLYQS